MHNINYFIFISSFCSVYCGFEIITSTQTEEINNQDRIKLLNTGPLWLENSTNENPEIKNNKKIQHRSFNTFTTDQTKTNLNNPLGEEENDDDDDEETNNSQEVTKDVLEKFLNTYSNKLNKPKGENDEDNNENLFVTGNQNKNSEQKSIKWNLLHYQKHNHPFEDQKGWVSMEPVPWSVSKISKWQSNQKVTPKPWDNYDSNDKIWDNNNYGGESISKPSWSTKPYKPYESSYDDNKYNPNPNPNRPASYDNYDYYKPIEYNKPVYTRPSAIYNHKVHFQAAPQLDLMKPNKKPFNYNNYHQHNENCNHHQDSGILITDGLPADFPQPYEANRRRGTEVHPDGHPFTGEGEWVLLSTTKGYKMPQQRQRSLQIHPDSIGAHRSVRLTVLPPAKNSKVNMTTSHGGLLQVESTFETVEQAQKQFAKKQKLKNKRKRQHKVIKKNKKVKQGVKLRPTVTMRRSTESDPSAVLAAVGAGMIPATMAMLVPMAMNGRRKRNAKFVTSDPYSSLEITLPRNL